MTADSPEPSPPQYGMSPARRRVVLVAVMAGMFMAAVESTIVATALPSIVGDLGGFHLFSWVFGAYLLTQAVTAPIYGRLADLYGRKRVFGAGALLFLISSAACGFAWNMPSLISFRALQGLGAGAIIPIAMTIVADIYPSGTRGRVQGYLSGIWGVSAVIGPLLGAFLVEHLTWSAVFWINIPLGILSVVLFEVALQEEPPPRQHTIDYRGALLLMVGSGTFMLALIQWPQLGNGARGLLLVVAAAALTALAFSERRSPEPMLPPYLWRDRIVAICNLGAFAIGGAMMGVTAFLPTYVQGVMGRSALVAGFALTTMSFGWSLISIVTGRLLAQFSFRIMAAAGGLSLVVGSVILILLGPDNGPLRAAAGALFIGIGLGLCNTTYIVAIQDITAWHRRGTAISVNSFLRSLGQSLATALFGGILNSALAARVVGNASAVDRLMDPTLRQGVDAAEHASLVAALAAGLHDVYLAVGAIAVVAFALALCLPKGLNLTRKG